MVRHAPAQPLCLREGHERGRAQAALLHRRRPPGALPTPGAARAARRERASPPPEQPRHRHREHSGRRALREAQSGGIGRERVGGHLHPRSSVSAPWRTLRGGRRRRQLEFWRSRRDDEGGLVIRTVLWQSPDVLRGSRGFLSPQRALWARKNKGFYETCRRYRILHVSVRGSEGDVASCGGSRAKRAGVHELFFAAMADIGFSVSQQGIWQIMRVVDRGLWLVLHDLC